MARDPKPVPNRRQGDPDETNPAPGVPDPELPCGPVRDPGQPAGERGAGGEGAGLRAENEERRLGGVLGVLSVVENADPQFVRLPFLPEVRARGCRIQQALDIPKTVHGSDSPLVPS